MQKKYIYHFNLILEINIINIFNYLNIKIKNIFFFVQYIDL